MTTNPVLSAFHGLLELIYPKFCAGCGKLDYPGICKSCFELLEQINQQKSCGRCGDQSHEISGPGICRNCTENKWSFERAVSAYVYTDPLSKIIVAWKYHGMKYLSDSLSDLLCDFIAGNELQWWESVDLIVPVAHHVETVHDRGFSPPEILSQSVSKYFGKPSLPRVLFKIRKTQPQMRLDKKNRMENIKNSMKVFDPSLVEGKILVVIDDVITTCATVNECARALKDAGASKVYALSLARQV